MKILLVAATRAEIEPLLSHFQESNTSGGISWNNHRADVLVSGVGMVATAYHMGRQLALQQYDLAINLGIAGSFDFSIPLGEVVEVTEDLFAEQGAEDGDNFLSIDNLGLGKGLQQVHGSTILSQDPAFQPFNFSTLSRLKKVRAITVNKVHGHELTIKQMLSRFPARIESMEGAAFFYACNQSRTPCLQLRSVSNYVERRNREKWDIALAVKNLNEMAYSFLKNL